MWATKAEDGKWNWIQIKMENQLDKFPFPFSICFVQFVKSFLPFFIRKN